MTLLPGGGIGSEISKRFAGEGATVVVCDVLDELARVVVEDIVGGGLSAEAEVFDVTDSEACRAAVGDVVARHGRIDVLVNNAGIMRRGDVLAISTQDWSATFAVNVDAMFHLCRAVLCCAATDGCRWRRRHREHRVAVGPVPRARSRRL